MGIKTGCGGQEHGRGQLDRGLVGNMAVGGGMNLGGTV